MNNKFFTYDDGKIDKLIFPLEPQFWWSRMYEYCFALKFVNKKDVVLDACCGLEHPFKFALIDKCKKVYGFDLEDLSKGNILESIKNRFGEEELSKFNQKHIDSLNLIKANITSLPYSDSFFNTIFCISSLEHMDLEIIEKGLAEFKRCLKSNGKIILTCDHPTLLSSDLVKIVDRLGLKIDGNYDYDIKNNSIETNYFGGNLKCYSMIITK